MKTITSVLILITLSTSLAVAQNENVPTFKYRGKPIVQMTLNGKKTWVLLDTGSDISVLNVRSKDKYKFNATREFNKTIRVAGFGSRNNDLYEVSSARLYLGDVRLKNSFYAYDISNIVGSIRAKTGKSITAIIGTNLMESYGFVIDLGNKEVRVVSNPTKKGAKTKIERTAIARVN